jgi:RNA polymerase sigma-70 factor (ECF subfamily)
MDAPEEKQLVLAAKGGDLAAFEALVARHERRIYGLARRLTGSDADAQDVTQQAFIAAIRGLASFRGEAGFGTWLTTIAANTAIKHLRKRRGLPTTSLDVAVSADGDSAAPHPEYIADWRETPDRLLQHAETRQVLDTAIAELDPAHRAVFLLRDAEGLSVRETAKALHLTEANVKVRLLRARMRLRERLTRAFGDGAHRYTPAAHAHSLSIPHPPPTRTGGHR